MLDRALILLLAEYIGVIAVVMIGALSPGFANRRPLVFQFPRREGIVSLSLYVLILFLNWMVVSRGMSGIAGRVGDIFGGLWPRVFVALIALLIFAAALFLRRQPPLSAGWNRALLGTSIRLALALVFLTLFLRGELFNLLRGITREQGYALAAWLVIALAEETIFRGYIQPRLSSWIGPIPGWLATAALFIIWQLPILLASPAGGLPLRLALAAAQAVLLGWIMRKTGHVLAPALWRAVSEWMFFL